MIYEVHKTRKRPPRPLDVSSLSDQGWREKDLENYLFEHLRNLLSTDLMVIGQSKPGEKADLVAIDREGELWLFELKKIGGQSENLLQVMRYSQIFGSFEVGDLDSLYRDSHAGATKSIAVAFCEWFGYDRNRAIEWGEKLGKRHHLVVVTDGTDDASLNAVAHWQRHGLDVQPWPYRIYKGSAKAFLLDLPELFIQGKRISRKPARVFFVNTSRQDRDRPSEMEKFMLKHECALTTGGEQWIDKIFSIPAGARVMLYANRVGVIASGVATPARWIDNPNEFEGDKAHTLKLREFRRLKQPLSVQEIFRAAGTTYRVSSVYELHGDAGNRVWDAAIQRL
jgi:hypothetical protein